MTPRLTTDEMVARYLGGDTMAAIATAAGVSRQAVEQRLRPAKKSGVIPRSLTTARNAQATAARAAATGAANFTAAKAQRWAAKGYGTELQKLVVRAAKAKGVAPAAREWGVSETSVRAWRDQHAVQMPASSRHPGHS